MRRAWLGPALALCALTLGAATAVYLGSGGEEIADDAPHLLKFARHPLVLWGDYRAHGICPRWGSFPPLLPLLFGSLVWPWTVILPDFWSIRVGALGWSLIVLVVLHRHLLRFEGTSERDARGALWVFALLPSVWGAAGLIPQEEIYASLFVLLLYRAGSRGGAWVPVLLVLTALAGKYFLLVLAIPLAFASPTPFRDVLRYAAPPVAALVLYVAYHHLAHGLLPILSYSLDASPSLSVWGFLWHLGVRPPVSGLMPASVLLCVVSVACFCGAARRSRLELPFVISGSLVLTLLTLSVSLPGYVLWAVPVMMVCWTRIQRGKRRAQLALLIGIWGVAEWAANFFRGVGRNLELDLEGKTALAERAANLLSVEFPFHALHLLSIGLVLGCGGLLILLLWREGGKAGGQVARG